MLCPRGAAAYGVLLRWRAADDAAIAGYHVHVRENGGSDGPPIDVRAHATDDPTQFEALLDDLAVETTYTFALSAYTGDGRESARSNERTITCTALDFASWRKSGGGTATIVPDAEVGSDVLVTSGTGRNPLRVRVTYTPPAGTILDAPVLASTIRDGTAFRVELMVRSTAGHRYRLRYEGNGAGKPSAHGRRLAVALDTRYAADAFLPLARDLGADLARLDPTAVLAGIERIRVSGVYTLRPIQLCR